MAKRRIGVMCDVFIEWGGGIDLLRLVLNGISETRKLRTDELTMVALIPGIGITSRLFLRVKNGVKRILNSVAGTRYGYWKPINYDRIMDDFRSVDHSIEFLYYKRRSLQSTIDSAGIDCILISFKVLPKGVKIPWVGYLYDFQHRYLPDFFDQKEKDHRDKIFPQMYHAAKNVIVNSQSVARDVIGNYGKDPGAIIHVLPFCPVISPAFFKTISLERYALPSGYFLISNQFWRHKDHLTAFRALARMLKMPGIPSLSIVCTGQTYDVRFPDYFSGLVQELALMGIAKNVMILGYIPKEDQLAILKNAIAVIQPTLFEGGPGGGAVYESVAYGIRSIVSDIEVNLELDDPTVQFFKAGSEIELCEKMIRVWSEPYSRPDRTTLESRNRMRMMAMGEKLNSILTQALHDENPSPVNRK